MKTVFFVSIWKLQSTQQKTGRDSGGGQIGKWNPHENIRQRDDVSQYWLFTGKYIFQSFFAFTTTQKKSDSVTNWIFNDPLQPLFLPTFCEFPIEFQFHPLNENSLLIRNSCETFDRWDGKFAICFFLKICCEGFFAFSVEFLMRFYRLWWKPASHLKFQIISVLKTYQTFCWLEIFNFLHNLGFE